MVIRGHPGAGKALFMVYITLYHISKGFYSTGAERMCHCPFQMGTQHCHSILSFRGN